MGYSKRYRRKGRRTKKNTRKTRSYKGKRGTVRSKPRGSKRRRRTNSRRRRGRKQSGGGSGYGFAGNNPEAFHGGHHPVSSYNTC